MEKSAVTRNQWNQSQATMGDQMDGTAEAAPPGHAHRSAVALLLLLAAIVAGCSSKPSADATSTTAPAPTTTIDPKTAIVAAYRAYWADVIEAGKTADAQSPRLDDHATGEAVATVRDNYRRLRSQGLVDRGSVTLHPRVTAVRGDTATIDDCTDVTHFLRHNAKTGEPAEPEVRDVRHIIVTLERIAGTWLVSNNEPRGQCEA